jgi:DNA-binding beta-propeller fold protein YncE
VNESRLRKRPLCLLILLVFTLLSFYYPPQAHADGGAPNLAYVSGTPSGVSAIDVGQAKVTKTILVAGDPHTILLSLDGRFLYVTQPALGQVSVIAAKTGQSICTAHLPGAPTLLAIDTDTNILYAAGNGAAQVSALDAATCAVRRTFKTESPVYGLAVALTAGSGLFGDTANQLWAAGAHGLRIFDDQTGRVLGSIALSGAQYLSIPPGEMVYVTTRQGSVDAVGLKTKEVHQILTGGIFGPMDYDAISSEVYVPDEQHNALDVLSPIDPGTTRLPKEPERVIHTGIPPQAVAITNDGLLGFVALSGGKVAMVDLLERRFVYTLHVGGTPHFIITGLYPPSKEAIPPVASPQQDSAWRNPAIVVAYALAFVFLTLLFVLLWQLRKYRKKDT